MPPKPKQTEKKGEQRLVECQTEDCDNWTVVWIPEGATKRSFTCGFCAYERLAEIEA